MEDQRGPRSEQLGRELSTAVVLFYHVVAERVGLNATELKCLDVLALGGPLMASQLAERLELTRGTITGIIDHLETGGFVHRTQDLFDRRRVIITAIPDQERKTAIGPIFASWQHALEEELAGRYSREEVAVIEGFLQRTIHVLRQQTEQISYDIPRHPLEGR